MAIAIDSTRIKVPSCGTLSDTITRLRGSELRFPSDPDLLRKIIEAIPQTPGSQDPPLYAIEDSATKDVFTANEQFVRDFIEAWEDAKTHVVTVKASGALRTFRAGNPFWNFVTLWWEEVARTLVSHDPVDALAITVTSSQMPRNPLAMSLGTWTRVVEYWNKRNEPKPGMPFAYAIYAPQLNALRDDGSNLHEVMENDDDVEKPARPRANAVYDPSTVLDDMDLALLNDRFQRRDRSSKYWCHFMTHWNILLAQYRNYL